MYVFDTIYLYDKDDRQWEAQVREINIRAIGVKHGLLRENKVDNEIICTIMRPKYMAGDRQVVIKNDVVMRSGWDWAIRPIPPIRKGAVVIIDNWDRLCTCKVLGLSKGLGGWRGHDFVFEGISSTKKENSHSESSGRGFRGHHFTAACDTVKEIISQGRGMRLLRGPFMTEKEKRAIFGY